MTVRERIGGYSPDMLTDREIQAALHAGEIELEPMASESLQPASYDLRVGRQAFVSGDQAVTPVDERGLVVIEAGEFAVLTTRERVHCAPNVAAQLGLASTYARQGLVLLSGPQVDPGFNGVLVVRVSNLSPRRVTLPYEAPFLTAQFFGLSHPVDHPYAGSRQGQLGLQPDIAELSNPDSPTIGGMVRSLAALAKDVAQVRASINVMAWAVPAITVIGIAVIGIIVGIK